MCGGYLPPFRRQRLLWPEAERLAKASGDASKGGPKHLHAIFAVVVGRQRRGCEPLLQADDAIALTAHATVLGRVSDSRRSRRVMTSSRSTARVA